MKNIVILAAGPPKPNRNRHLELFDGELLIDRVINNCRVDNTRLYVVVNKANEQLQNHVNSLQNVEVLIPEDEKIRSTFKTALSMPGDCILVCGDLVRLRPGDIEKFIDSKFDSAICRYQEAWGPDLRSHGGLVRRSDMGDCINMIAQRHKEFFLGDVNYERSVSYFKEFYPNAEINEYVYNDIGTHMTYSFFKPIWGDARHPGRRKNSHKNIGTIYFDHKVYEDND